MNAQDENFAYKVRHALNEKLDELPDHVTKRLAASRRLAVSRKKAAVPVYVSAYQTVLAGRTGNMSSSNSWLSQMRLWLPLFVLVAGLLGIFHYEEQRHIKDSVAIDMAVLSDELPPAAYTDIGFSAYLERHGA